MLVDVTDDNEALPITLVTPEGYDPWSKDSPQARDWLKSIGFAPEANAFAFIPDANGQANRAILIVNPGADIWALGAFPLTLPERRYAVCPTSTVTVSQDMALGWMLGSYAFNRYRKARRGPATLVWPAGVDRQEVERLSAAVFLARDMINTPAQDMGPDALVDAVRSVGEQAGAKVRIVVGDDLLAQNYPTIHAVGRAGAKPPALVDLVWGDESHPKVTLVGKGVCFDSGGLNIKPADGMLEMKRDMGGAAVVLGLAQALMSARAPIRLRVLVPAVENAIAGNAMRPLDVVRTRCGKTVEIGHTDAEGRLILCDALSDADAEAPDLLIDCATLTGAARTALGPDVQPFFCDDAAAANALVDISMRLGDPLWRLPLWRPYRKRIDGKVADLNNVAQGPHAGAIIAALYLSEFVSRSATWAHLDISAANTTTQPGRPEGGEATSLRALYACIRQRYG